MSETKLISTPCSLGFSTTCKQCGKWCKKFKGEGIMAHFCTTRCRDEYDNSNIRRTPKLTHRLSKSRS